MSSSLSAASSNVTKGSIQEWFAAARRYIRLECDQNLRAKDMLKSISCVKMWVNAGRKTQNKCDHAQLRSNRARKSGTYAECCVTMKLCTTLTIPQPSAGFS